MSREDGMCPLCEEYSAAEWYAMEDKLAAREKRMREVAARLADLHDKLPGMERELKMELLGCRAKLLEGIEAE